MASRFRTDDRGLIVDGRALPFYAGALHYWRSAPTTWTASLRSLRAQGLRLVETCVPWRVHATPTGFDFTASRDLPRFLDEAAAADLAVVIRPGPTVNAELTCFGIPDHVLRPPNLALTARNTPAFFPATPRAFPIPSYSSTAFLAEVRTWFAALAAAIADRPIAAIGVDHETGLFFRTGAFDLDYHPDALAHWHETNPAPPPRDASDPLALAWVHFKQTSIARALSTLSAILDDVGLTAPRVHNAQPTTFPDLPALSAAINGHAGIDVHSPRTAFATVRRRALHTVGSSPLPLALESAIGQSPFLPPIDRDDDPDRARDQLLTLLSAGIRGFNLYMAVDRERWTHAPTTFVKPLITALDAVDWPSLRRHTPIALVASRVDSRHAIATNLLDPVTPFLADLLGLDLGTDASATQHRRWFTALEQALSIAGVAYTIVDENAPPSAFATYRAVIIPTLDRLDSSLLATLQTLKATIVVGPGTPTRDELDRPLTTPLPKRLGRIRPGSLDDLPSLAADLAALADPAEHFTIERPAGVEASLFTDPTGTPRVVFVQSFSPKPVTATLTTPSPLRDPFAADPPIADGRARISLPAHGIRMFLIG